MTCLKVKPAMWIKIESTLGTKPEVFMLANLLTITRAEVVGHLVNLWTWVDQNTENGAIKGTPEMLDELTKSGFANALENVGWLQINGNEMQLPNFDKHNGQTAKTRAQVNRRVAKHRKKPTCNGTPVAKALPDKIRLDKNKENINHQGVVDLWNKLCTPKLTKITPKRKTAIKALLAEYNITEIERVFALVPTIPFLNGVNDRQWRCDFEYCTKIDKFLKIAEGGWATTTQQQTNYTAWNTNQHTQ
jgi:hypothetical protein